MLEISFEHTVQFIQSNVGKFSIKILKAGESGSLTVNVKAIGGSLRLIEKYPNRAIKAQEFGDFYYEDEIITFGENQTEAIIEVLIYENSRTNIETKEFKLNLVNINNEIYNINPNKTCTCYINSNVSNTLSRVVDRFLLPKPLIIQNIISGSGVVSGDGDSGSGSGSGSSNSGGSSIQQLPLVVRKVAETNDRNLFDKFPFNIYETLTFNRNDIYRFFRCSRNGLHKALLFEQYTPGTEYKFEYEVHKDVGNSTDILVQLIDMNMFSIAQSIVMDFMEKRRFLDPSDMTKAIEFIKRDSVKAKLPLNDRSGSFTVVPSTSRRLMCFCTRKSNGQPDGIAFEYEHSSQTFLLRSF